MGPSGLNWWNGRCRSSEREGEGRVTRKARYFGAKERAHQRLIDKLRPSQWRVESRPHDSAGSSRSASRYSQLQEFGSRLECHSRGFERRPPSVRHCWVAMACRSIASLSAVTSSPISSPSEVMRASGRSRSHSRRLRPGTPLNLMKASTIARSCSLFIPVRLTWASAAARHHHAAQPSAASP